MEISIGSNSENLCGVLGALRVFEGIQTADLNGEHSGARSSGKFACEDNSVGKEKTQSTKNVSLCSHMQSP